jgi:serine/threonine protein kinase
VLRLIGSGSSSYVYACAGEHGQQVAVKVGRAGQEIRRFLREATLAQRLRHPHVVQHLDSGLQGTEAWMAMELLAEAPLAARLPLDPSAALRVALQLSSALVCMHEQGVLHRDINASNVVLVDEGRRAVLLDFGLGETDDGVVERTYAPIGTLAPEVLAGARADSAADIYSFGLLLGQLWTGKLAFDAPSGPEAARVSWILQEKAQRPSWDPGPPVPDEIRALILRMTSRERLRRPKAEEVWQVLRAETGADASSDALPAEAARPRMRKRLRWALAASALALLVAGAVRLWTQLRPPDTRPLVCVASPEVMADGQDQDCDGHDRIQMALLRECRRPPYVDHQNASWATI